MTQDGFNIPEFPELPMSMSEIIMDGRDPQQYALMQLGSCEAVKGHDDGDLTVECEDTLYIITTDGRVFREVGGEVP